MSRLDLARIVLAVAASTAGPTIALADMGTAPAGHKGVYVSGEGGYFYQDGGDVNGYGASSSAGSVSDVHVSADDGWFAGGFIGYENGSPLFSPLPFTRVEGYFWFGTADDSVSDSAPPLADITLKTVDGATNVTGGTIASVSGRTTTERDTWEGGFKLEFDQPQGSTSTLTWVLNPFVRNADEDTSTVVTGCCELHRNGSVETWMYGAVIAVEPEFWLTPGVAFVGRLGAGLYGYDSDADFRSYSIGLPSPDPFRASASDGDSGIGFRGQLGAGLKFKLGAAAFLETFAEADYFSDVATAQFSNSDPADGTPSRIEMDDLWELKAGARVTIGLGGN